MSSGFDDQAFQKSSVPVVVDGDVVCEGAGVFCCFDVWEDVVVEHWVEQVGVIELAWIRKRICKACKSIVINGGKMYHLLHKW